MAKPEAEDDRDKRIEDLKRRAEELCGGQMEVSSLDDGPAEMEESFWKHVVDYEEAEWTTNFQQLEMAGVSLPTPDSLNDQELTAKLWEVIDKLALLGVFIEQTDHLSDRELYTHLWTDTLREETKMLPPAADSRGISKCSAEAAKKITSSTSSITLMTLRAGNGTRISPMIPFPLTKTRLTTVTVCCPSRVAARRLAGSPTDALRDRLQLFVQ